MGMVWMYVYMCRYLYLQLKAFLGLARLPIGRVIDSIRSSAAMLKPSPG